MINRVSFLFIFTLIKSQPIDLSIPWNTNYNIPFLTELDNTIENEVASLSSLLGLIVIYKGKVVSENYYYNSSI